MDDMKRINIEITNAQYIRDTVFSNENRCINCTINGKHHSVPLKVGNRYYDEIMHRVEEGTLTIAPAD